MLKRAVLVSVLVGWSSVGCGLRENPEDPGTGTAGTGDTGGTGGGAVGVAGRGGTGGSVGGTGGRGGTAGSVAGTGGSVAGTGGSVGGTGGSVGGTGGSVGGTGGSTAGTTGRGGTGGSVGGTGGSTAGTTGRGGSGGTGGCGVSGACRPTNMCHVGQMICTAAGAETCMDTGTAQANGIACGTNMVCNNGTCVPCTAGTACTTANPCKTAATVCTSGASVCTETGNKANGTSCGTNMVCQNGTCMVCQAGAACTPMNPCHLGMLACSTGAPVCTDRNVNAAAGTSCGTNMVCNASGVCGPCTVGSSCSVSGMPCKTAANVCTSGAPVCTVSGNVANGTSCGTNMVCQTGSCVSCTAGLACAPTNPCHAGTQTCSPSITCSDTNRNLAAGTSCGTNMVCNASGVCGACTPGAACTHANACKVGTTSCVTGVPVCAEMGNKANGTSCGTNQVCNNGTCGPCTMNTACTTNPGICRTGTTSCSSGTQTCVDSGNKTAGTSCGLNMVCNGTGTCVPCTPGIACTGNPTACKNGTTSCTTGAMTCIDGTNKAGGTSCGTNLVCNGSGSCISCTPGNTCTGNPGACKIGTTACTTGAQTCVDSTSNKAAGVSCGTDQVCDGNGSCGACAANQSCTGNPNPCYTGITSCATGSMVCNNNTQRATGASCGTNKVCNGSASCVDCTAGVACNTNPSVCKVGVTWCGTGAETCVDSGNKPDSTLCGAGPSCNEGMPARLTPAQICDTGACITPPPVDCNSDMCNSDGTACDNGGGG